MSRGRYAHETLWEVAQALGYTSNREGVCSGYTLMWARAAVLGEAQEAVFDQRIHYICRSHPLDIADDISQAKQNIKLHKINKEERFLIDLLAFFEGIEIHIANIPRELFEKPTRVIRQQIQDLQSISYLVNSIKLGRTVEAKKSEEKSEEKIEGEGGLAGIYSQVGIGNHEDLARYFKILKALLIKLAKYDLVLSLNGDNHIFGLRFDKKSGYWKLRDANHLPGQDIHPNHIVKAIQTALIQKNISIFNLNIFSTGKNAEQIKKYFMENANENDNNDEKEIYDLVSQLKSFPFITQKNLQLKAERNFPLLYMLVSVGDLINLKKLVAFGADLNQLGGRDMYTPLMVAASIGQQDIVEYLLEQKVKVNEQDTIGDTALIHAMASFNEKVVKALIENNADVNLVNKRGMSALMFAAQNGLSDTVELLLNAGANVNQKSIGGYTAAKMAAVSGEIQILQTLIKKGAEVTPKILLAAVWEGIKKQRWEDIINLLVEHDAAKVLGKHENAGFSIFSKPPSHAELIKQKLVKRFFDNHDFSKIQLTQIIKNELKIYQDKKGRWRKSFNSVHPEIDKLFDFLKSLGRSQTLSSQQLIKLTQLLLDAKTTAGSESDKVIKNLKAALVTEINSKDQAPLAQVVIRLLEPTHISPRPAPGLDSKYN